MDNPPYRLVRRIRHRAPAPELDDDQRRVVDHEGGPLLVLAGPGTGKTTTIVEAIVDRVENRGVDPAHVLVLTFSRKAAQELRERITARLRRTVREPLALTFHSYAYALIRREFQRVGDHAPRLLSGPEQLMEVRELLKGELADGAPEWPEQLRPMLHTRGFAEELRDFLMRVQERGLHADDVRELGRRHGREDWVAAGGFLERYTGRFDIAPVPTFNYAELVRVAANLLNDPDIQARERAARKVVFVDEYQDTDPAQEELLHALAGDGRDLVVVGDPDQSIYGFRGAEVRNILNFPDRFRTPTGDPAPVVALHTCRRSGAELLRVSRALAQRLPAVPGPGGEGVNAHRNLVPAEGTPPGRARVLLAESPVHEAAAIADLLRRAHLIDGVPWSRMAVLVRSVTRHVPVLRRALIAADVPVTVDGDDLPLASEPLVRSMLLLLRCALHPERLDEEAAHNLLTSAFGEADALGLRRLGRALRQLELDAGGRRPAAALLAEILHDPRDLVMVDPEVRAPAERIATLLRLVRDSIAEGANAEEVLWRMWHHSGLADTLLRASQAGGRHGAAADRELDSVMALFERAARYCDRLPPGSPEGFLEDLEAQEIPGDTLAEQAPQGETVRILTAHRSKGLEWDLVVVAGVQEGTWPDLRLRGSLLGVEQLLDTVGGFAETSPAAVVSKQLDEERRLFYVALTRARRELVVTAVGGEDVEERPSRFLTELGLGEPERLATGYRWLSLPALVADLRATLLDPHTDEPVRRAAAAHLARLADAGVRGADPAEWYALTELSDSSPLVLEGEQIRISPSQVEKFTTCELRWLLETAAGAEKRRAASGIGSIVHALARIAAENPDLPELLRRMDQIWSDLDFGGPWYAEKQRERAEEMLQRFLDWQKENPRELVATEKKFRVEVGNIEISGQVDRLERDAEGRGVIVDIKTGTAVPDREISRHPQLGVYQLALLMAAFEHYGLVEPGGAALLQIGDRKTAKEQTQPALADDADPEWPQRLVQKVAAGMAGARFRAKATPSCRHCSVRASCPVQSEGDHV
ncbi:ATP-dependent helicase [Thermobifida fusca]|uniref:ATP-dependent helicase n=1 Tax=Thermobifida fusca TaxID=2021 RepID=UPI000D1B196D|nr:ATP-dependent DNA helicase [Thermobifida fusca]